MTDSQHSPLLRPLLGIGATILILAAMRAVSSILNPVMLAIFFALLCYPILKWLQKKGLTKGWALLIMTIGVLVVGISLILLMQTSLSQLSASLDTYQEGLEESLATIKSWLQGFGLNLNSSLLTSDGELLVQFSSSLLLGLVNLLSTSFIVIIMLIFALVDAADLQKRLQMGLGADNPMLDHFTIFSQDMIRYFVLRTKVNFYTGALATIMLFALGIDYALLWGILTFFLSYLPYIGILTAMILPSILALAQYGPAMALIVIIGYTIINVTAENLVAPTVMGRGLKLSPFLVFVAVIFWTWLLGLPGTLLSMPLTVGIVILLSSYESTRWLALVIGTKPKEELPSGTESEQKV